MPIALEFALLDVVSIGIAHNDERLVCMRCS